MREKIPGSKSYYVGHKPQKVATPYSLGSKKLEQSKIKVFSWNHFL